MQIALDFRSSHYLTDDILYVHDTVNVNGVLVYLKMSALTLTMADQ